MTSLDPLSVRVDPAAVRELGSRAVAEVVALMSPTGDCDVCHRSLGQVPVAIAAVATTTGTVAVTPRHAACGSATWQVSEGVLRHPVMTHQHVEILMPGRAQQLGRRQKRSRQGSRGQDDGHGVAVVINPSVDAQVGAVTDGRWQPQFVERAREFGVIACARPGVDRSSPTWGVQLDGDVALLRGPASTYDAELTVGALATVRRQGGLQVLLAAHPDVHDLPTSGIRLLEQAMVDGHVWTSWAELGRTPARIELQAGPATGAAFAALRQKPDSKQVRTTDELRAMSEDRSCNARALFLSDPVFNIEGLPATLAGLPVLLVETPLAVLVEGPDGAARDLRVETAIAQGLEVFAGLLPRNPARDWAVRAGGATLTVEAPYRNVIASAPKPAFPKGWLQAATASGHVLVLYGPALGVRPHADGTPYTDEDRSEELASSRLGGHAACGAIAWR